VGGVFGQLAGWGKYCSGSQRQLVLAGACHRGGRQIPHLAQAFASRRMLGGGHKTDEIDARALATVLRNGTLPEVWVPEAKLRDVRSLLRSRLNLRHQQTDFNNRV